MFLVVALVIIATLFYYAFVKPLNYWKTKGVIQNPPVVIFGNSWKTALKLQSLAEFTKEMYDFAPDRRYTGMYQMMVPSLVIRDPELLKQITVKDFEYFTDHRSFIDPDADPLWGKNLFSLKGQRWRDMRATLSPSFTGSKMRYMFTLMMETAENFINFFKKQNKELIEVDCKDIFSRFSNDVIASIAFGVQVDSLENRTNEFFLMGKEATNFKSLKQTLKFFGYAVLPKVYKWFKIQLFTKNVQKFFTRLIEENIKEREEKGIVRPDMVHLLLEARRGVQNKNEEKQEVDNGFAVVKETSMEFPKVRKQALNISNLEITANALIFFFGGFDTISTLMCFLSYELATNQDIQRRLRKAVMDTLKENEGNITYESLLKMKYLDMVVSETLRKWPPGIQLDRVCTKPYVIDPVLPDEKPLRIERNDVMYVPVFGIHHDPKYYPDPDKFDPERFSDENKDNINPYTYIPFGLGPRNCIASRFALLESKALIFQILNNFEIVPTEKTQIPLKMGEGGFDILPKDGVWVGFKKISC